MLTITLTDDDGGETQLTATMRDVLVWEKTGHGRSVAKLYGDMHIGDVYAIAHIAVRRQQMFTGTLKEFEEKYDLKLDKGLGDPKVECPNCGHVFEVEGEAGVDPTRSGPSIGG